MIARALFLLLFLGAGVWIVLQKNAADKATDGADKIHEEIEKTRDNAAAQRALIDKELSEQDEAQKTREAEVLGKEQ